MRSCPDLRCDATFPLQEIFSEHKEIRMTCFLRRTLDSICNPVFILWGNEWNFTKSTFLVWVWIMRNSCMNEWTTFYKHLNEDKTSNNCTNKKLFKYVKGNKTMIKQVQSEELFRIKWDIPQWYFEALVHFCLPFKTLTAVILPWQVRSKHGLKNQDI